MTTASMQEVRLQEVSDRDESGTESESNAGAIAENTQPGRRAWLSKYREKVTLTHIL